MTPFDQLVLASFAALGGVVFAAVIGVLSGTAGAPADRPAAPRVPITPPKVWTCAVCDQRSDKRVDRFGQHVCSGFGRCGLCGYEVESRSGEHFCPPAIAARHLAVQGEINRQRGEM